MVIETTVCGLGAERTPSVLGSWTEPPGPTLYPWSKTSCPSASTVTRTPWRSCGTTIWVVTPGTSSVGLVPEQPAPPPTPADTATRAPSASAFKPTFGMTILLKKTRKNAPSRGPAHPIEHQNGIVTRRRAVVMPGSNVPTNGLGSDGLKMK